MIIEFLITSLAETLFPHFLRLVGQSSLGKVLVLPNLLHFRKMKASVVSGTFRAAEVLFLAQVLASTQLCL